MHYLRRGLIVTAGVSAAIRLQVDQTEHCSFMSTEYSHALAAVKVPATHRTIVRTCMQIDNSINVTSRSSDKTRALSH